MAIKTSGQRPFPAVAIVLILLLACLFLGQRLIAPLLPGISGLAKVNPSLTILDIPVRVPFTVDLILVPGLFIILYTVMILVYPSRRGMPSLREVAQRQGAVFAGAFIFLICVTVGGLITYLVHDHLPQSIRNGISSLAINADISLPYTKYKTVHLQGNIPTLLCFIIGTAIFIAKISRTPQMFQTPQLTREQRMTPYARMMQERREQQRQGREQQRQKQEIQKAEKAARPKRVPAASGKRINKPSALTRLPGRCSNEPLLTLQPEAVNYRPM
ncbi:hypothetical protein [Puia dinghuensis]|nr:hypothetical protein [Puia dinghuensis]